MKTLIVSPNWIGDAVMAQPLIASIKRADPHGRIDVLAPPATAAVFAAIAEVDDVIEHPAPHGKLELRARFKLGRALARRKFDQAYVLPNSLKSALVPFFAGVPRRIGYRGEFRYGLLNLVRDANRERPMVEFYARLALPSDQADGYGAANPLLERDPAREAQVRAKLALGPHKLIVLAPGAEYGPAKRWPPRHYAALANLIARQWKDAQIVLVGSAKDRAIATEILALSGLKLINACGETSLDEAIALIAQADGVVSNDSGLMHVAAAYGRPQVAVFGSSDPRHTPPRSSRAKVQWLHLECSPCFARQCPLSHTNCLNQITPASTFAALRQIQQSPSAARG